LVACSLVGCNRVPPPSASAIFEQVQKHLLAGNLAVAEREAHKAQAQFLGSEPEWAWKFRSLEAKAVILQGRSQDALKLWTDPLPASLENGDVAIERDMNRALAWARMGQFPEASDALAHAQKLVDQNHSPLRAELLSTRGVVDIEKENLDDAESMFRQGLDLARQQDNRFLESTLDLNIGVVALHREHYDEALYWSHAASKLARTLEAGLILEKALANEGWAYYKLGDFERSLANSQEAAAQAEKLGSAFDQVTWLNNAGLAMVALHDYKAADTYYKKSLAIAEATQNRVQMLDAHVALAFEMLQQGQAAWAKIHIDRALDLAKSAGNQSAELEPLFLNAVLATRNSRLADAEATLKTVYASPNLTPSLRWEVEDAFANVYARQEDPKRAEEWYLRSIATFESQRSSLHDEENRLPFFSNANQLYLDYVEFLVKAGKAAQALQILDDSRARTLEEGLGITPRSSTARAGKSLEQESRRIEPRIIAKSLDGTVLEYLLGPNRSYLWAVTPTAIRLFNLPGQSEIDTHVEEYQREITNSTDVLAKHAAAGEWLYANLVAPAQALIPRYSRVFLIPDGSLNKVNFETFLTPDPSPHFWLEDATLTTANSLRLLRTFRSHPARTKTPNLLLIGDPIPPAEEFADLPNGPEEIASISSHFSAGNRKVLTKEQASPQGYFANQPGQYQFIHFVAHGIASQLSPLDSAVVLSRTSDRPDDFKLYARNIVHFPLRSELVTISACYGSGTKAYSGEGLVGLSWAFLRAGSHNVIGAMWAVSDASTPQLMDRLYKSLEKGTPPDVALREAKLSLAHSTDIYRKPLYWGAFQLYAGA